MRSANQVKAIKDPVVRYRAADHEAKAHRSEAKELHVLKCAAVVELRESGLKWREISEKLGPNPGACVNLANEVADVKSAPKPKRRRQLVAKPVKKAAEEAE